MLVNLLKQKWVQLVGALAIGITVGAVFYPQKRTETRIREEIRSEYALKEEQLRIAREEHLMELGEKIEALESSHKQYEEETQSKMEKLVTENSTLKQSMKRQKLKIVRPDGTIVEKEIEESNTEQTKTVITQVKEEFNRKVKEIEEKWKKVHEERVVKITQEYQEELKRVRSEQQSTTTIKDKEVITETNPKKLRPEVGVTSNQDVYLHGTYNLWGPVVIGGGVSGTNKGFGEARVGVGLDL